MKMILVYVAGRYTAPTPAGVEENCRIAREVGVQLAACGKNVFPVIPHKLGGPAENGIDEAGMYAGTLELMRRCDVVYACPGWETSKGTLAELAEAERLGIPVIRNDLTLFQSGLVTRKLGVRMDQLQAEDARRHRS